MLKPVQLYNATEYAVARRQDALATFQMTRQVKKVGVITRSEAFHYVDQLRASDVRDDLLQIGAGGDKTAAGQGRWVPIHSALQPVIDRLVEQTRGHDVYLLQSTAKNKYAKRSAAAGKRFGRLKDHLFGEGAQRKVFHSFRRTLITALLNEAEAPKHLVSDIIGHADGNVTTGLYRSQAGAKELRKYLERVTYPFP